MTLKFFQLKFLRILITAVIICSSCTRERQKEPITWLYGYGQVDMLYGNVKQLTDSTFAKADLPIYLVYTFDKKGNVVKVENIYQGGINTIKYNTVYKNGRKAESIGLDTENKRMGEVYRYDNYGHIISFGPIMNIKEAGNPSTDIYRFWYDKAGNLVEQHELGRKQLIWIHKFKYLYNEKGAIMGLERAHSNERSNFKYFKKDTIRYILFDSKNNWLKAIRFGDTITRKITYY